MAADAGHRIVRTVRWRVAVEATGSSAGMQRILPGHARGVAGGAVSARMRNRASMAVGAVRGPGMLRLPGDSRLRMTVHAGRREGICSVRRPMALHAVEALVVRILGIREGNTGAVAAIAVGAEVVLGCVVAARAVGAILRVSESPTLAGVPVADRAILIGLEVAPGLAMAGPTIFPIRVLPGVPSVIAVALGAAPGVNSAVAGWWNMAGYARIIEGIMRAVRYGGGGRRRGGIGGRRFGGVLGAGSRGPEELLE